MLFKETRRWQSSSLQFFNSYFLIAHISILNLLSKLILYILAFYCSSPLDTRLHVHWYRIVCEVAGDQHTSDPSPWEWLGSSGSLTTSWQVSET